MNRYFMIRRLRWPAILVLLGVVALLYQAGAISHFWHFFVPLLLILLGVLLLAERAALAAGDFPSGPDQFPGNPYSTAADPLAGATAASQPAAPGTSIVPAPPHDIELHSDRDRGDRS
jgi:hypothetical protein